MNTEVWSKPSEGQRGLSRVRAALKRYTGQPVGIVCQCVAGGYFAYQGTVAEQSDGSYTFNDNRSGRIAFIDSAIAQMSNLDEAGNKKGISYSKVELTADC